MCMHVYVREKERLCVWCVCVCACVYLENHLRASNKRQTMATEGKSPSVFALISMYTYKYTVQETPLSLCSRLTCCKTHQSAKRNFIKNILQQILPHKLCERTRASAYRRVCEGVQLCERKILCVKKIHVTFAFRSPHLQESTSAFIRRIPHPHSLEQYSKVMMRNQIRVERSIM